MSLWTSLLILGGLIVQVFVPGFPKETLLLQSGLSYGWFWGSVINWLGMVIGAQIAYEASRQAFLTGGRMLSLTTKYQESTWFYRLDKYGNKGLLLFRLVPFAPNDVLSLLSGLLLLPRRGFILVSVVTALPYAIIFAYFGAIGADWISAELLLTINLLLMGLSLAVLLATHFRTRGESMHKPSED